MKTADEIRTYLRENFGIESDETLITATRALKPMNISIFTEPPKKKRGSQVAKII